MKKQIFSLFLLFLLFSGVSAQKVKQSKTEKRLRTHVAYLASDRLEGRRTGEQGATYAAGYVSNMFSRYKLKAPAASKSYLQSFQYITGVELGAENSLIINNSALKLKTDWMPLGFSTGGNLADASVVFAGYGITSSEIGYDSYDGLDIRGKIALIFAGTPESDNPHSQFARYSDARIKAKMAGDKGARGLLIISGEMNFEDEKLAGLQYDQTLGETSVPTAVISRSVAAELLGERGSKELDEIEKWFAMRKDAPEGITINLADRPQLKAVMKVELTKKTAGAYNVIGILEGRDPVLKNEAIVIGAHYDHLGRGGRGSLDVNSNEIHHGADDNASGTSAMIELARQLRKEKKNKRTLIFIGFGGEEEGLLGSKHYVNNPVFPLEKTVAMINMDMVGRLNDGKLTVGGIGTAEEMKALVEGQNTATSVRTGVVRVSDRSSAALFDLQLNQDGFGPSDHSSFYGKQIPVLFFFTGTHSDYHKPTDTAEKINYQGLETIAEFVSNIIRAIDRNPTRPTYTTAPSSGMSGGRRGFTVSLGTVPSYADNTNDGLVLDGVRDDSPAAAAGIKAGDKIIRMAGSDIKNISDYVYVLGEMKAGEEYDVVVIRDGQEMALKIVPEARK